MHYIFLHLLDNKVFYLVTIFTLLHHNLRHFHQTPRANVVNVPRDGPRRSVYKYLQAQRNVSQPFFRTGTPTYLNIYKSKTKAAGGTWRLPQHCQARNKNPRNTLRDIWNFILFFFLRYTKTFTYLLHDISRKQYRIVYNPGWDTLDSSIAIHFASQVKAV